MADKIYKHATDNCLVNATMCMHLAKGKELQYCYIYDDEWYDFDGDDAEEIFGPWCYQAMYSWRVKPKSDKTKT